MGGCTDCTSKGGCDERKGVQRGLFDEVMGRIYPDRTWGRPDDEARFGAGISRREAQRLGRAMAELLRAPTFFRAGADDDLCDFVYVLCLGRAPALVEVREGRGAPESSHIDERYLRVALSSVARIGAVQEVAMTLDDPAGDGAAEVRETPKPGVFDPILLARMRKLVALLEASDIAHIDFGLLDRPVEDSAPGDYEARYGVLPRLANFLFFAQPPTTASITLVPR
ncbi:MAG: hypothetical protein EXR72_26165 [Myxococcales bacterium]|nr:hypothetical protein [Myxococcales bacterium]